MSKNHAIAARTAPKAPNASRAHWRAALFAAVIGAAVIGAAISAPAAAADLTRDAALIVRVLAYDGRLAERAPGSVVQIGILYTAEDPSSQQAADSLAAGFAAGVPSIGGKEVRTDLLAVSDGGVDAALGGQSFAAIYVCPGLGGSIRQVTAYTRAHGVLSFTGNEDDVRAGVAVGLISSGAGSKLVIAPAAARAEGTALNPSLLSVAQLWTGAGAGTAMTAQDPDEPIRPKHGMAPPTLIQESVVKPAYTRQLEAAGIEGRVELRLEIRRDGTVGRIERNSGEEALVELAAAAMKRWRYRPALLDGQPQAVWKIEPYTFVLAR